MEELTVISTEKSCKWQVPPQSLSGAAVLRQASATQRASNNIRAGPQMGENCCSRF